MSNESKSKAVNGGARPVVPEFARYLLPVLFGIVLCAGCASLDHGTGQAADDTWQPMVSDPAYPPDSGPAVLVDAGHGNFHTIDGRFAAFARLLELDGFRVEGSTAGLSPALLAGADVFVIANAVHGGETAEWILPTAAAFTPEEIDVLVDWVRDGGSLLLIADHMPFPGAVAGIADRFGIVFHNGYAMASIEEGGSMDFTRSSGRLADHAITRGRSAAESVSSVRAFTGQAFRFVVPAQALLHLPEDWEVYLPLEAGEFGDTTPLVPARGLLQGGVMRFGSGRVAVFGEAALFTAQSYVLDGVTRQMGMNHPSAAQNAQFVLNVMHWLTGLLDGLATAD